MSLVKYEIINPSDKCFLSAKSLKGAALAVCFLGEGKYALNNIETGEQSVPLFLFGGHDKWLIEKFGQSFEQLLDDKDAMRDAAEALKSAEYDAEQSSLNNIVERAHELGELITEKLASGEI